MGINEISKIIAEQLNLKASGVKLVIQSFCDNTVGICHVGGRVTIQNFGYFESHLIQGKPYKVPDRRKGAEEGTFIEGESEDRWVLKYYSDDEADKIVNEPIDIID